MLLLAIISMGILAFAAVWLGFLPPPHASTIIRVRAGGLRVTRGKLRPHARDHVSEILAEAGIVRGFIAITPDQRVSFSRHIPSPVHQRLRNVLVNQWA